MGKTLLLTGHPRSGKTTIIKKVIKTLGDQAGGFYTEEIFGAGGRKGFKLITLDGKQTILSHKDLRGPKIPKVGRYGVDVQALERVGVQAMHDAMKAKKIIVIDEIGKMELLSHAFCETVMLAIMGTSPVLGTVLYKPHPEADAFKGLAQVTLWEVNPRNRNTLPRDIKNWLNNL